MNRILPERWSMEWFSLTTTEELAHLLREAKKADHDINTTQNVWRSRILMLEAELRRREMEQEDPERSN